MNENLLRVLRLFLYASMTGLGLFLAGLLVYTAFVQQQLPHLPERLGDLEPPRRTTILDRNGLVISRIGSSLPVSLEEVSPLFVKALLATEDDDFLGHHGIDKQALLRALLSQMLPGRRSGGSTLTQQLAKNMFFTFEKKVDRKLREILLAVAMEARYDKRDILEAYCNTVDFGAGSMGVEAAAQEYFDRSASELDVTEAATLVAILNAPTRYNPRANPAACRDRRNLVLSRMEHQGHLDRETAARLKGGPLKVRPGRRNNAGHLRDWILADLEKEYREMGLDPETIPYAGLEIHTSVDGRLQDLAQQSLSTFCDGLETRLGANATSLDGAVVALDPRNGEVLALVGGRDYLTSAFNCALSPNRQPGSSFKPFFYYTTLRNGWSPLDIVVDSVQSYRLPDMTWTPRNWDYSESGSQTWVYGLMKSLNVVVAGVAMRSDLAQTIRTARDAGITAPLERSPSLTLGTFPVRPLELAQAYGVFVNRGIRSDAFVVRHVTDRFGREVLRHKARQRQAFDPVESYLVLDMLRGAVRYGTGGDLLSVPFTGDLGGKTGTTDDYRDSWFCAVMPRLVCVSWVGNRDNHPMRFSREAGVTGAAGGLKVFKAMLPQLEEILGRQGNFPVPDGVEFRSVNLWSGREDANGPRLALRMIDL
ncbi:MAG: transglycosylase domain-containing protein [bacterium]|nr:transglycosylase domain-containing protein [bacterium]